MQDFIGWGNREIILPNPSLLWLYFTSRPLRNCMYMGMAAKVAFNALFRVGERGFNLRNSCFVGLFAYTSYKNIGWTMNQVLKPSNESSNWLGNWFTSASSNAHLGGSWFFGGGNGEWYAFLGHNSPEEVQVLPQIILDQMKMRKKGFEEEDQEDKEDKPFHQSTPRFEEVFENEKD